MGSTHTGKTLPPLEQILSFKSRSPFGRASSSWEGNWAPRKLFPFVKNRGKCRGVHIRQFKVQKDGFFESMCSDLRQSVQLHYLCSEIFLKTT